MLGFLTVAVVEEEKNEKLSGKSDSGGARVEKNRSFE